MKFDKDHSSVHLQCEFFNKIPYNLFEMISVCLQRRASRESLYIESWQAWNDGLMISFGPVECVLYRDTKKSVINICLRCPVDDLPELWTCMDIVLKDVRALLSPWGGVIVSLHFVCGHCVIMHIQNPKLWLPKDVFPKPGQKLPRTIKCPKEESASIPAALLMSAFSGE